MLVWIGLLVMTLCRWIATPPILRLLVHTELKPSFTAKQNDCGLRSGIDPVKLPVYIVQLCFTLFVMESTNHSCFIWLLYQRLLGVRLVSTCIVEHVALKALHLSEFWGHVLPSLRCLCVIRSVRSGKQMIHSLTDKQLWSQSLCACVWSFIQPTENDYRCCHTT